MKWIVKKVESEELYPIRNDVLRKNKGFEYCKFKGDNLTSSAHFGVLKNKKIVGGVSLIVNNTENLVSNNVIQLRGMCVYEAFQKQNVGLSLLNMAELFAIDNNYEYIWMNARKIALDFYLRNGYINNFRSFNIEQIGKHYFLFKKIK